MTYKREVLTGDRNLGVQQMTEVFKALSPNVIRKEGDSGTLQHLEDRNKSERWGGTSNGF